MGINGWGIAVHWEKLTDFTRRNNWLYIAEVPAGIRTHGIRIGTSVL